MCVAHVEVAIEVRCPDAGGRANSHNSVITRRSSDIIAQIRQETIPIDVSLQNKVLE